MSAKGKERAVEPVPQTDEDDELDFFTFKPKKVVIPRYSPTHHGSDDGDSEDGLPKKKTKKKKKDKLEMANWTKGPSSPKRSKKRGSTESSRARSSSSQADGIALTGTPDKGKGRADGKKRRVELTPPPEWGEEQVAKVNQLVNNYLGSANQAKEPEEIIDEPYSSDRDEPINPEDIINIRVRMKSDPAKKAAGSENAVRQWEKLRTFKFPRRKPLSVLVNDLAMRLSKSPEELVLVHDKQRIMSTRLSPFALGIVSDADMEGYEKLVWEAMEKSRLEALDDDPTGLTNGDLDQANIADAEPAGTATAPPPNAIIVHIRCEWGEEKLGLQPTHTIKKLLRHYARKHGKESEVDRLTLVFDGEQFPPSKTMEEVGLESGDLVDLLVK